MKLIHHDNEEKAKKFMDSLVTSLAMGQRKGSWLILLNAEFFLWQQCSAKCCLQM